MLKTRMMNGHIPFTFVKFLSRTVETFILLRKFRIKIAVLLMQTYTNLTLTKKSFSSSHSLMYYQKIHYCLLTSSLFLLGPINLGNVTRGF